MNSIIEDTFAKYAEWVPVNKPRTRYSFCGTSNADLAGKLSTICYLCLRFDPLINRKHGIRRFKSNCFFFLFQIYEHREKVGDTGPIDF